MTKYYSEEQLMKMYWAGVEAMSETPHAYDLDDDFERAFKETKRYSKPLIIDDKKMIIQPSGEQLFKLKQAIECLYKESSDLPTFVSLLRLLGIKYDETTYWS